MPSSDERRKGLRAALPAEFFFNVLGATGDYVRGQSSVTKRLASIDSIKIMPPKTEAQALLYRIDQKLSLIIGMMAESSSRKTYLYQGTVQDISEFGLSFGHAMVIESGAVLEIGLKLPNPESALMDIAGKVVHVKNPTDPASGYSHIYGVEFFDILSKDQNDIVQWIFTHQREQIRRRRENAK
ncbi:hypothetical protein C4J81_18005 [Deltaproteobacteria bacterium Smac51]|nr:hypothetical protein C4J81_18005 [Deltaproteobacteria bacterium Smac51]